MLIMEQKKKTLYVYMIFAYILFYLMQWVVANRCFDIISEPAIQVSFFEYTVLSAKEQALCSQRLITTVILSLHVCNPLYFKEHFYVIYLTRPP